MSQARAAVLSDRTTGSLHNNMIRYLFIACLFQRYCTSVLLQKQKPLTSPPPSAPIVPLFIRLSLLNGHTDSAVPSRRDFSWKVSLPFFHSCCISGITQNFLSRPKKVLSARGKVYVEKCCDLRSKSSLVRVRSMPCSDRNVRIQI